MRGRSTISRNIVPLVRSQNKTGISCRRTMLAIPQAVLMTGFRSKMPYFVKESILNAADYPCSELENWWECPVESFEDAEQQFINMVEAGDYHKKYNFVTQHVSAHLDIYEMDKHGLFRFGDLNKWRKVAGGMCIAYKIKKRTKKRQIKELQNRVTTLETRITTLEKMVCAAAAN